MSRVGQLLGCLCVLTNVARKRCRVSATVRSRGISLPSLLREFVQDCKTFDRSPMERKDLGRGGTERNALTFGAPGGM